MDPARQDQNDIPFLYIVRREIQRYISFPLFDIYDLHIGMPVKWDSIEVQWYGAQIGIVRKQWIHMRFGLHVIFIF